MPKLKRFWSSSVCSVSVACLSGSEVRGAVEDLDEADALEPEDEGAEEAEEAEDPLPLFSSTGDNVLGAGVTKLTAATDCSSF